MLELVLSRQYHTDTSILELWSTGTTEDLQDIQDTQVDELTSFSTVKLGAFDDDCVGWQVDTPSESRCAYKNLDCTIGEKFFDRQVQEYAQRRSLLSQALDDIGLSYTIPHGGYFIMADAAKIKIPEKWVEENDVPEGILKKPEDYLKAWFIAKVCDVVVIPATAFYAEKGAEEVGKNYVRFSFCKDDQIEQAAPRLKKLIPYLIKD